MKKASGAQPNQHLRHARELRGWSQHDVAQRLDVERYYVSRWERGVIFPSPHYRQRLCTLFDKNVEELGFVTDDNLESDVSLYGAVSLPIDDPTLPVPTYLAGGFIGREALVRILKAHLASTEHHHIALHGLPGIGKTALALALAHDPEVRSLFPDGILWASVGPTPHTREILSRWGVLLGLAPRILGELVAPQDWLLTLRTAVGNRKIVFMIDDIWSIDDAMAFVVGGMGCAHVMTTRLPNVAHLFAPLATESVTELSSTDGLRLLAYLAPAAVALNHHDAQTLANCVGGLPLALTLIGNSLRTQAHGQQPRRIRQAMQQLQHAEQRFALIQPQARIDALLSTSAGASSSLEAAIDLSTDRLDATALTALHTLALFPPKPHSFSEEAALYVTNASTTALDMLSDSGLLESAEPGRYTLHQAIRDYAQQTGHYDATVMERFITFYVGFLGEHRTDFGSIEEETILLDNCLRQAQQRNMQAVFLRGVEAYIPFLTAHGFYTQALDYLVLAESIARASHNLADLLAILLPQGIMLERLGEYERAESTFQEGIALAESTANAVFHCKLLRQSGLLAEKRGDYPHAQESIASGILIARQLGGAEFLAELLLSQGALAGNRGEYAQADAAYREGLLLARATHQEDLICQFLANLGALADNRGDTVTAIAHLQEGAALAHQLGNRELIARLLTNLAVALGRSGDLSGAEAYLHEGIALVREMGFREQYCLLLFNLAELYKQQRQFGSAEQTLQTAETLATQLRHQRLMSAVLLARGELLIEVNRLVEASVALKKAIGMTEGVSQHMQLVARFALAKIVAMNGNFVSARQQGEMIYRQFTQFGHTRTPEVRAWLDSLPT